MRIVRINGACTEEYEWPTKLEGTALRAIVSMDIKRLVRLGNYSFQNLVKELSEDLCVTEDEVEEHLLEYNKDLGLGIYISIVAEIKGKRRERRFVSMDLLNSEGVIRAVSSLS